MKKLIFIKNILKTIIQRLLDNSMDLLKNYTEMLSERKDDMNSERHNKKIFIKGIYEYAEIKTIHI